MNLPFTTIAIQGGRPRNRFFPPFWPVKRMNPDDQPGKVAGTNL